MTTLLAIAIALPLLLLPAAFGAGWWRRLFETVAPWAALPALLLSLAPVDYPRLALGWLLIGSWIDVDPIGRIFLVVTAALWTAAGVFARHYVTERGRRFMIHFLLTMAGNLGLTVAGDAVSFYLFFALMTFAGYGLIVHRSDEGARRAGRIYLILAVVGEAFLLAGLLLAVSAAGSTEIIAIPSGIVGAPSVGAITACILLGFAIKAGAVPLHVWLPLAHPVAPTPASAVLSGSMIKAGLLGWIRFLPLGEVAQPTWGSVVIATGVVAAFFGVIVGVVQTDAKTVLAYSSISQMGLMNIGVGTALAAPSAAPAALAALTLYTVHHGLAKGALFLGVGVVGAGGQGRRARRLILGALGFLSLAIAGAPLTSGNMAKAELKYVVADAPGAWAGLLEPLLIASAGATTLLMLRLLALLRHAQGEDGSHRLTPGLWAPWAALVAASVFAVFALPRAFPVPALEVPHLFHPDSLLVDLLPILGAVLLYALLARRSKSLAALEGHPPIEPGDILLPIERAVHATPRPERLINALTDHGLVPGLAREWYRLYSESDRQDRLLRLELALTRWPVAIAALGLLFALLLALATWGPR